MKMFFHRGIMGTVRWSLEDNLWHGRLLEDYNKANKISKPIKYEGQTYDDLYKAFEKAVEQYYVDHYSDRYEKI